MCSQKISGHVACSIAIYWDHQCAHKLPARFLRKIPAMVSNQNMKPYSPRKEILHDPRKATLKESRSAGKLSRQSLVSKGKSQIIIVHCRGYFIGIVQSLPWFDLCSALDG